MPSTLPEPGYPGHYQVRRVSKSGMFRFDARQIFISDALIDEHIALEEVEDGLWSIYFYNVLLGRLDQQNYKIRG